jgi:hypothetical protein
VLGEANAKGRVWRVAFEPVEAAASVVDERAEYFSSKILRPRLAVV